MAHLEIKQRAGHSSFTSCRELHDDRFPWISGVTGGRADDSPCRLTVTGFRECAWRRRSEPPRASRATHLSEMRSRSALRAMAIRSKLGMSLAVGVPSLGLLCALAAQARANGRMASANELVVSPVDPTLLAVETTVGLFFSHDMGATFGWVCEASVGYADGGDQDPTLVLTPTQILAGTHEGVSVSADRGCSWKFTSYRSHRRSRVASRQSAHCSRPHQRLLRRQRRGHQPVPHTHPANAGRRRQLDAARRFYRFDGRRRDHRRRPE